MLLHRAAVALLLLPGFSALRVVPGAPGRPGQRQRGQPCMGIINENSLAAKMFGTISEGVSDLAKMAGIGLEPDSAANAPSSTGSDSSPNTALEKTMSDLDRRAQSGDLTFSDFITMSRAFENLNDDNMPGVTSKLSAKQIAETREKFGKHEKIVEVMLDEEKETPSLLIDDLKQGGSRPGPRIQRLAEGSGESESEVALFLMQFEAMRESTRRIAAGEDPDAVTESMGAAPAGVNRKARRAEEKKKKKKQKQKK